jgi:hypothetical protein
MQSSVQYITAVLETLPVSPNTNLAVTPDTPDTLLAGPAFVDDSGVLYITCLNCPARFPYKGKNRRTCSSACRQAVYRGSSAYRATQTKEAKQRFARRQVWLERRRYHKTMSFDGREQGPLDATVPTLSQLDIQKTCHRCGEKFVSGHFDEHLPSCITPMSQINWRGFHENEGA